MLRQSKALIILSFIENTYMYFYLHMTTFKKGNDFHSQILIALYMHRGLVEIGQAYFFQYR